LSKWIKNGLKSELESFVKALEENNILGNQGGDEIME